MWMHIPGMYTVLAVYLILSISSSTPTHSSEALQFCASLATKFHSLILVTKPNSLKKSTCLCFTSQLHKPSTFPLIQIMMNLGMYLSTTHFLKRKSQHWFKSNYAAET